MFPSTLSISTLLSARWVSCHAGPDILGLAHLHVCLETTRCSEGYNIRNHVFQLHGINTHTAELRISAVRRLKAMLSYMIQDNFMPHLKLYRCFRNALLKGNQADEYNRVLNKRVAPMYTKLWHRFRAKCDLDDWVNSKTSFHANFIIIGNVLSL